MNVFIDGDEVSVALEKDASFDDITDALKKILDKDTKIITGLTVDGEFLTAENESGLTVKKVKDIKRLEVVTDTPENLARVNLENSIVYLDTFSRQLDDVIEVLRSGGEEETYNIFVDGINGLEHIILLMDVSGQLLGLNYSELEVGGTKVLAFFDEFMVSMKEFGTALKDKDNVYLQDLLQYEMKPSLVKMKSIASVLLKKIDQ